MFMNKDSGKDKCKIKIAVVGCGRISKKHINAIIAEHKRCELIALCDNNQDRIDKILDFYSENLEKKNIFLNKIKKYSSYEELINAHLKNQVLIDLIVLATPSGLHPIQTTIAASAGINVCTEKPMALTKSDAEEMVKTCEKFKIKLFVVKQNRLNPTIQALKKKVNEMCLQ